ncbi:hypothetical protein JOY44_21465 [Phormidium sp. CLA17]|uniref:hypothetical protein n=1 Tax=Leptolyngbya sp. Cla-17 TaxID=2803751 RepID=UPI001490FBA6|nr:hypothetical protein [Leptolyngbya sp. Cla-17]MBM0744151.1 hypothetical protein [Leptolyngbya sp. Cla-17]
MLQKTLALGVCFLVLAGCSTTVPPTQSGAAIQTREESDNESAKQERTQLAAERVRETRQQSITAKIKPLEQEMELLAERMLGRQQKLSNIELQKNQLKTELETYNRNVNAFMAKYQVEVVCREAVGASLSKDNQYSEDAKNLATAVTMACGVGVLADGEFGKRVIQVVDQLNQADRYAKDLRSQIQTAATQLEAESQQLEAEKAEVSKLTSDIQTYQAHTKLNWSHYRSDKLSDVEVRV